MDLSLKYSCKGKPTNKSVHCCSKAKIPLINHVTYLFGTDSKDFGNLGMVVAVLNQIWSLIGPFSLWTDSGGNGFLSDPCPQALGYPSHSQYVAYSFFGYFSSSSLQIKENAAEPDCKSWLTYERWGIKTITICKVYPKKGKVTLLLILWPK